jgi:small-conductance mechanosensitive channel
VTVLGIAFFAQWSILSNITAGLVIFFNHPLRLGDQIRITEKDYLVEGKLVSISFFFLHIVTKNGEEVTIPNSMALQKTIAVITQEPTTPA